MRFIVFMFPFLFFIVFAIVIIVFAIVIVKAVKEKSYNDRQPVLSVAARVVSKRQDVSYHHNPGAGAVGYHSSSSRYYATFEVESGDRMELYIQHSEYGYIVEGDYGHLTFRGRRFIRFERTGMDTHKREGSVSF